MVDTIEDFCLLCTESVRGQLNSIIPAAIKGQLADKRFAIFFVNFVKQEKKIGCLF